MGGIIYCGKSLNILNMDVLPMFAIKVVVRYMTLQKLILVPMLSKGRRGIYF